MEDSIKYGQMDFNLPHDVVTLPSQGKFYKNKKKSLKVGYLTAQDENIMVSAGKVDNLLHTLVRNKIYEPNFKLEDLLESDLEAILIFLRNTAFGPDYTFNLVDPKTNKEYQKTIQLDRLEILEPKHEPNSDGFFEFTLPKTNDKVVCKLLTVGETEELNKSTKNYPSGVIAPIVTNKLSAHIISINGNEDRSYISQYVNNLPISDSKYLRNYISDCEPRLNLEREVETPSGEKVTIRVAFGVEFFRPFF